MMGTNTSSLETKRTRLEAELADVLDTRDFITAGAIMVELAALTASPIYTNPPQPIWLLGV